MSKYAKNAALVARVVALRDAGTPWDATGGIVDTIGAEFPIFTGRSAIPLRKLYVAAKAAEGTDRIGPKARKAIVKARDGGAGWDNLAARTGLSITEVKAAYTEGGGKNPTDGRLYVSQDGTTKHVAESTVAIGASRKAEAPSA
jgi:hypothetical protein